MGRHMRFLKVRFTSWSFLRNLLATVFRRTVNLPFRVLPHMCVKPRKSNVSGFPSPRLLRRSTAKRPNSMSQGLLGVQFQVESMKPSSTQNRSAS
jgi:hypothetical protein